MFVQQNTYPSRPSSLITIRTNGTYVNQTNANEAHFSHSQQSPFRQVQTVFKPIPTKALVQKPTALAYPFAQRLHFAQRASESSYISAMRFKQIQQALIQKKLEDKLAA